MEKLFYMDKTAFSSSEDAAKHVLSQYFNLPSAKVVKNELGKPFIENTPYKLFLSVSHTDELLFIAVCDENVGIDAELKTRDVAYAHIVKRFPDDERAEIHNSADFLRHWTVKEAAVKWLGGKLAKDLKKLRYVDGRLTYDGIDVPVRITEKHVNGHVLSICSERDFEKSEIIAFP